MTDDRDPAVRKLLWRMCLAAFGPRLVLLSGTLLLIGGFATYALVAHEHPFTAAWEKAVAKDDYPGMVNAKRAFIIGGLKRASVPREDGGDGMAVPLDDLDVELDGNLAGGGSDLGGRIRLCDAIRSVNRYFDEVVTWDKLESESDIDAAVAGLLARMEEDENWTWLRHIVGTLAPFAKDAIRDR